MQGKQQKGAIVMKHSNPSHLEFQRTVDLAVEATTEAVMHSSASPLPKDHVKVTAQETIKHPPETARNECGGRHH